MYTLRLGRPLQPLTNKQMSDYTSAYCPAANPYVSKKHRTIHCGLKVAQLVFFPAVPYCVTANSAALRIVPLMELPQTRLLCLQLDALYLMQHRTNT